MPMANSDFIQCNIRVPQPLYQKIETIAIANGAKMNSPSQEPQIASTLIELLRIGVQYYSQVHSASSEDFSTPTEEAEAEDSNTQILAQQLESFNQMVENQQQYQQTIEQYLTQIQASQQFTQVDINHLYQLMGQLCNCLQASTLPETAFSSQAQLIDDQPLATNLDQWIVNRQWLSTNGCFCEDSFEHWQNGEVRQDQQGRSWRRVELANVLEGFKISSDLAPAQVFYVLEPHH